MPSIHSFMPMSLPRREASKLGASQLRFLIACTSGLISRNHSSGRKFQHHPRYIDPFLTAVKFDQQHPILVFEEVTGTGLDNTDWLTDFPVKVSSKIVRRAFRLSDLFR